MNMCDRSPTATWRGWVVSPQSWSHGGGGESFWRRSAALHIITAGFWLPPSSCLIKIMFRLASNRTSVWKSAWLKTKLPEGERCADTVFPHAYIMPLKYKLCLSCFINFEMKITDCAMSSEPHTRAWNVEWHKIHMTDEIVIRGEAGVGGTSCFHQSILTSFEASLSVISNNLDVLI